MTTTIKHNGRTYKVPIDKADALARRLRRADEGHQHRKGQRSTRGPDRRSAIESNWTSDMGRCPARINGRV